VADAQYVVFGEAGTFDADVLASHPSGATVGDVVMKDPRTLIGSGVADCMDNSCTYAKKDGGMRTNGGCRCDKCPTCGAFIRPGRPHRGWCSASDWIPPHLRIVEVHRG
jgi:hypothetical protein